MGKKLKGIPTYGGGNSYIHTWGYVHVDGGT
jgi:hypothetical protein